MKQILYRLGKALFILVQVAAALAATIYFVTHKPGPSQKQTKEAVQTMRVIPVPGLNLVPRAEGYGVAEPVQVWEAVAEVRGRVTATHPNLQPGQLIKKDSLLIRIDPTEYRLAVARLEAAIAETRAKIAELDQNEANTRQIVAIETQSLAQILIPLVISTAFGLMASTTMVLLVIPCMYVILGDLGIVEKMVSNGK